MSRRPFSLSRFSTNPNDSVGRAERAWYANEVVWTLTGTYTDKQGAICLTKLQNQQFFRQ